MIWIGVAIVVAAAAVLISALRRRSTGRAPDDVDPLFSAGIVLVGVGVVFGAAVGPGMYAVMAAGLVVMAIGANRTRHHPHR